MAASSCRIALSTHIRVMGENALADDLASQIEHISPIKTGSFGKVYRCAINEGKNEVAVKVFIINPRRSLQKLQSAMDREVAVWLKLSKSDYVVPLLDIANLSPESLPALVSEWMPSGTLDQYLQKDAKTLAARVELSKGVAGGVNYLRLEKVVHGDLHPGNVLIDREGNPRLTDFGLAIVVGEPELQWGTTTAALELNARWRAPEVLGIEREVAKPTFMSDIYSLGSIIFFIISGDIPWKEKRNSVPISVALSQKATPTRPENILNGHWNLIQQCWSRKPEDRPESTEVLECIKQLEVNDLQAPILNQPVDLTGQIIGEIKDLAPRLGGNFTNVYKCECKQASGRTIKVAVKIIKFSISNEELERFHRETKTWAILEHDHIIRLLGTAREFGPPDVPPALVFPWVETTLPSIIQEQGAKLSIRSKLDLLCGTASALEHLHCRGIVHGDVTSPNILVDISDGRYRACLTDIGLAKILSGHLANGVVDVSHVQLDAVRWTSPELLSGGNPTKENDMYSFGCIMLHLLTLRTPWHTISNNLTVVEHIRRGEHPEPPHSPDLTNIRWNMIRECWSAMVSRPSASVVIDFLKGELEALASPDTTEASTDDHATIRQLPNIPITMEKQKSAKNIVIFGAMGAGKSSLVNLIADQDIARTEHNPKRCTLTWTKYVLPKLFDDEMQHNIFDTRGIDDPKLEPNEYHRSIKNASRLLHELDTCGGTNLLVYCVQKGRDNGTLQSNYQLFREVLYQRQVPIVMVVTCLEDETVMEEWWTRNRASLEASQIVVEGHACVTTLKNEDTKYKASREAVRELIQEYAAVTPVSRGWKHEKISSAFMRWIGYPDPEYKKSQEKLQKDLEGRCGMKTQLASKVAKTLCARSPTDLLPR
ncbi:kinase-like domain-containing protein [Suillus bovinus]|uniref:kinase-like domain-containing protein n=1 Tax=Suillus bovinus TaxID=48563 RepID=UPI001B88652B|nr:kinase-like domain-containing protein [Suillus bovinus]KAG2153678.1 kinase-like domain-containing protein [Suillus bovinus]